MVRLQEVSVGETLSSHYPEFEHQHFRVFRVPRADVDATLVDPGQTVRVRTLTSFALAAGVSASLVQELPPISSDEVEAEPEDDWSGLEEAEPAEQPRDSVNSIGEVEDRLKHLYVSVRGAVSHRYTVEGMLSYLELASYLKPSSEVHHVLAASAGIFFGAPGRSLAQKLRNKEFELPSLSTLRSSRLRLDLVSVLYERKLFLRFESLLYDLADSSPQLGYNLLGVIEDTVRIPQACCVNILERVKLELNEHWDSLICPLSSLGLGHAGLVKKSLNTANLSVMSVASWSDFDKKECGIGDGPQTWALSISLPTWASISFLPKRISMMR